MTMRVVNLEALRWANLKGESLYYRYNQDGKLLVLNSPVYTWAWSKNYDEQEGKPRQIIGPSLKDNGQSIMRTRRDGKVSFRVPGMLLVFTSVFLCAAIFNFPYLPILAACYALYASREVVKYGLGYKYGYMAEFMSFEDMVRFLYLRNKYLMFGYPSKSYTFKGYSFESDNLASSMDPREKVDFLVALDLNLTFVFVPREIQKNLHKNIMLAAGPGSVSLALEEDKKGHLSLFHGITE